MEKICYTSYACERDPKYQLYTQIIDRDGSMIVRKTALNEFGTQHICKLKEYETVLIETYSQVPFFRVCPILANSREWVEFEYQSGYTVEQWLEEQVRDGNIDCISEMLSLFWESLIAMSEGAFIPDSTYHQFFGDALSNKEGLHGARNQDIDLVFSNLFFEQKHPEQCTVIDYEWIIPFMVPLEYIYYRSVFCSVALSHCSDEQKYSFYEIAGIKPMDLPDYLQTEISFQKTITGNTKTMEEHFQRMARGILPLNPVRNPYKIIIRDGSTLLEENQFCVLNVELDLSVYKNIEQLNVQVGYPFCVVKIDSMDNNWCCNNAEYSDENTFMAGSQPLRFFLEKQTSNSLKIRIAELDELEYQKTIKNCILSYASRIGTLETQVRSQGDEIQRYVDQIGTLETQVRSQGDEIQRYVDQIGTLETQVRSQGDEIQRYVDQIGTLETQVRNQGDEIQSYVDQIGTLETQVSSQIDQLHNKDEQLSAYATEWKILVESRKVLHKEPVALIRQKQQHRKERQIELGLGPDATIVIPTKNGGDLFKQVLDRIYGQVTKYTFEVICVDSGSTDNTLQIIHDSDATLYQIKPEEFGHGKTRNFGASLGTGEYICFLTQDALPVHESWLENMLDAMKLDPQIVGGFGRHLPYSQCNFIDERDINGLFDGFGQTNTIFWNEDPERYNNDPGYRSVLAFFSDNNSCLKRSVWEQYPYPEVEFAEDQIWMRQMIEKGYKKVYCPEANVYHSHNFDPSTYLMRYFDEYKGLYELHGYINLKHWWYIPAAIGKHVISDIKYIKNTNNTKKKKLGMFRYSIRRNYARYMGGYIGGHYHEKSSEKQRKLDCKYSQQYKQRRGI